jgi:hypothetical protein
MFVPGAAGLLTTSPMRQGDAKSAGCCPAVALQILLCMYKVRGHVLDSIGLGLRVYGSGFKVIDRSGFKAQDLRFRVEGLLFRVMTTSKPGNQTLRCSSVVGSGIGWTLSWATINQVQCKHTCATTYQSGVLY